MFKKILKFIAPIKYYLLLFFILIILALLSMYLIRNNLSYIDLKVLHNKSTADIYIQNDQLKISFQIIDSDKQKVKSFSDSLGINTDFLGGISLTLDPNSISLIKQNLPMNVNLDFNDKQLNFSSISMSDLNSSIPMQNYEISTGSAKLTFNTRGSGDFDLNIDEPDSIIEYATSSGKLYLSNQIQQLFPIMSKVAKIRLVLKGKNASGNILLK